ncbi:MAG: LssY C-terminal domain-containing protein [Gemmatimonadaceae bacterium]|nr:LssY C-terminal domain-containing protein [Gemmatimonadaceae bacterium]
MVYGPRRRHGRIAHDIAPAGAAAASGVGVIPTALFAGYRIARRGARASVLAGEIGSVRLVRPLELPRAWCQPVAAHPELSHLPPLPEFLPHTGTKRSERAGDPINLIFIGTAAALDSAFLRAGWTPPARASLRALAHATADMVTGHRAVRAPISTQYFEGRPYDLAYELAGPTLKRRHHVRIWLLDSAAALWVGAADEDVGLEVKPLHGHATHRIDPNIDRERDLIVAELEATGCADLMEWTTLPGAQPESRNASGQRIETDGCTAIVMLKRCPAARGR